MIKRKITCLLAMTLVTISSISNLQGQVAFNFDNCMISANAGPAFEGQVLGQATCDCSLVNNGYYLNGNGTLVFPDTLYTLFKTNFTLDFYFNIRSANDITDVFSFRSECDADSVMALRFFPQRDEFYFELSKDIREFNAVSIPNNDNCWHRFTLVRNGLNYIVYFDNERISAITPNEEIPMSKRGKMSFSGSPCLGINASPMNGAIDEFRIYSTALSQSEIRQSYLYPEQITNKDTTIISGGEVQISFGAGCYDLVSWSPITSLDDPSSFDPIASPEETTTYTVTTSGGGCVSQSDINIYVVAPSDFDCSNLLLPTAFTPNDDQINDVYGISNTFLVESIQQFYIMDEWGNRVFEGKDKSSMWNGVYNGTRCRPGVYTYVINYTCQGQSSRKVGTFLLLV